ncbi:hypothetical protein EXW96_16245 [Paenibacillus sp. JMULE4]|uniref:multicopper oxidase domain-containing protein n=1 Tax=Paenibacillus sp. JMULE4 TaxID=2518342 RepID=UPI001575C7E8|nr:hypothetical protein [Paenibacillus sp. JMULE4]
MIPFIQGLKSKAIRSHIISLHKQEVSSGIKLNLYSYNGTVPGQEIRVKVGQQVEVNLKNELDQPVTIHWHGYPVPVDMDGVPGVTQNAVKPGESFQYSFTPESVTNLSPLRQRGQYMEKSNRKSPHQLKIRDENKSTNDRIHQARHAQ